MPTLHWIGKEKVINHHLDVPFRVLEHIYGYDGGEQLLGEAARGNRIIHGDILYKNAGRPICDQCWQLPSHHHIIFKKIREILRDFKSSPP